MKIALMGGAYKNAGDFLIEKRSEELLCANIPDINVTWYKRDISYDDRIGELNDSDAIVFTGGPGYQQSLYPSSIPFVKDITKIQKPIFILGWGWKGINNELETVYRKDYFKIEMKRFLEKASDSKVSLGCRDYYTQRMLKNQGFETIMTGCPAWYDLRFLNQTKCNKSKMSSSPKICISDPAYSVNETYVETLVEVLRKRYKNSKIIFVFHRGEVKEYPCFNKYGVDTLDISGKVDGFQVYDECDMHIGFRVHAHIYNLGIRNRTILLNEDARGMGVNQALGLENINLLSTRKFGKYTTLLKRAEQENFALIVQSYLEMLEENDFYMETAFQRMQFYYQRMKEHILKIESVVKL